MLAVESFKWRNKQMIVLPPWGESPEEVCYPWRFRGPSWSSHQGEILSRSPWYSSKVRSYLGHRGLLIRMRSYLGHPGLHPRRDLISVTLVFTSGRDLISVTLAFC